MPSRRHAHDGGRPVIPSPVREHPHARGDQGGTRPGIRRGRREQLSQGAAPPEIGEPCQRPPWFVALRNRDITAHNDSKPIHAARPLGARLDGDSHAVERRGRDGNGIRLYPGGVPDPRAPVAPATGNGGLIVEGALQKLHAASGSRLVVEHRELLGCSRGGDALVSLGVVAPLQTGGDPPAGDPLHRSVDVKHLQQQFEGSAPQVDPGFDRCSR